MSSSQSSGSQTTMARSELIHAVTSDLKIHGVDGFFMTKTDAHRSEYCSDEENLVAFFTEFTGSMGACAVLTEAQKGAVFVDGRYTLQANQEVDTSVFDIIDYKTSEITSWFQTFLKPGSVIGFDPNLMGVSELSLIKSHFIKVGLSLKPLPYNPVQKQWYNQPLPDVYPLKDHDVKYAGVSRNQKLKLIRDQMQKDKVESFFLNFPESICWLLNLRAPEKKFTPVAPVFAVIPLQGDVSLFCHANNHEHLHDVLGNGFDIRSYDDTFTNHGLFTNKIVALDKQNASIRMRDLITSQGGTVQEIEDYCDLPRAIKNGVEQNGAKAAHVRDGVAMCHLLAWLENHIRTNTITELDVVEKLWTFRQEQGLIKSYSFDTISGSGPNGAIVHYRVDESSNRTLNRADIFLLDSGGQYLDGTTDVTRTISLDKNPTLEQKDRYTRVLKGHIAISTLKFPKHTTGSQIDVIARQHLWSIGANYAHGTGHGVGSFLGVHEGPQKISPALNTTPLVPGMIVSNEPGYYKTGEYGIRIENLELIRSCQDHEVVDGNEMYCFDTLTLVPIDTSLVDKNMLSPLEVQWLNDYHSLVYATLKDRVQDFAKQWLKDATQPI